MAERVLKRIVIVHLLQKYTKMQRGGMTTILRDGTVLHDRDAIAHMRTQGKFVWSVFENEVLPTFTGTTKREWLDRWDEFIGEKICLGWYCDLVGVNPYWRGKVGKLATQ